MDTAKHTTLKVTMCCEGTVLCIEHGNNRICVFFEVGTNVSLVAMDKRVVNVCRYLDGGECTTNNEFVHPDTIYLTKSYNGNHDFYADKKLLEFNDKNACDVVIQQQHKYGYSLNLGTFVCHITSPYNKTSFFICRDSFLKTFYL